MIESIIEQFRTAVASLLGTEFEQTIFTEGDVVPALTKYSIDPAYSIAAASSATVSYPKPQLMPFTNALADFAGDQQMAIRFERIGQDPTEFQVDLYREDLMITGSGVFTPGTIQISIYKTGDRSISDATIAATLAALKEAVEKVPGVAFSQSK